MGNDFSLLSKAGCFSPLSHQRIQWQSVAKINDDILRALEESSSSSLSLIVSAGGRWGPTAFSLFHINSRRIIFMTSKWKTNACWMKNEWTRPTFTQSVVYHIPFVRLRRVSPCVALHRNLFDYYPKTGPPAVGPNAFDIWWTFLQFDGVRNSIVASTKRSCQWHKSWMKCVSLTPNQLLDQILGFVP